ncbi:50S ribosomal protein L9 [Chamaesiphon sp. VAR_48_metabat_135_sub]|uniref:50S ribosomal protein L9 n=1 Tax=Chamaesiphon sp. VAR_48_metabat_135_sub TaxID=2964699 RepID=UPI00286B761D|nr:50S ribosomal protein L9 [Chamaesiphon sp. VAR_48_metabat_135_sub]
MAKRIQLVLTQDVRKLGKNGDLVEVAPGYARNYLLPQKIAANVTPGILKQAEKRREVERLRLLALKEVAQTQKAAIEKVGKFSISKQVGENDAIFGTVTTAEVAEVIKAVTGQEIDKRDITIPDVAKIGTYRAELKLHPEVVVTVEIEVVSK